MVSGGMADGGVWIGPAPRQDGVAIDDEIAGTDEAAADRRAYHDHEQCLGHGSASTRRPFPLLRGTGHLGASQSVEREVTGARECGPTDDPVVQVLIREAPELAQEGEQQQRFLTIPARTPAKTGRQRGWTAPMSRAHGEATQRKQMQPCDTVSHHIVVVWASAKRANLRVPALAFYNGMTRRGITGSQRWLWGRSISGSDV